MSFDLDSHARRDRLEARRNVGRTWELYVFAKRAGVTGESLSRIWQAHKRVQCATEGRPYLVAGQ